MYDIIKEMIENADIHTDYELADIIYNLMYELATTYNIPSNWDYDVEQIVSEYCGNNWIYENCKLYTFI